MQGYRCFLITANKKIGRALEFHAADDAAALTEAERLLNSSPSDLRHAELWHLARRVGIVHRTT